MGAKAVTRFERAFAEWLGAPRAFAFWKGRVGLYAILRGLGIGEGDQVVLPGYTCVVVANPVKYLGAKPVYADIEPETYNIAPDKLEAQISPRTRAVIMQHTYGYPADSDKILAIARARGIPVIEDACLSVGSTYHGKKAGTFGAAAYWSMQWNKMFTTGMGGMATVNEVDLADKIEHLCRQEAIQPSRKEAFLLALQRLAYRCLVFPRTTGGLQAAFRKLSDAGVLLGGSSPGEDALRKPPSFFKRMSDSQARAGLRQMRRLEENIRHRREMKRIYDELLADRGWPVLRIPEWMDPVLVRYPVRVADKGRAMAEAPKRFIELGTWFDSPLHQAEAPLETYDYTPGCCPVAEQACREVVNLPMHRRANERVARRTVDFLCEIGPASG